MRVRRAILLLLLRFIEASWAVPSDLGHGAAQLHVAKEIVDQVAQSNAAFRSFQSNRSDPVGPHLLHLKAKDVFDPRPDAASFRVGLFLSLRQRMVPMTFLMQTVDDASFL